MKENRMEIPMMRAKIDRLVNYGTSKVKAIASVDIGGVFAVHGLKIIESQKGLFVQMPQSWYEKDGKKHYSDQFHPVTAEGRQALNSAVLDAYDLKLGEAQDVDPDFDADMQKYIQNM